MAQSVLTVRQAAATTGWSARMLRYVDEAGLVRPARSDAGYRLYGPAELQRLRTLRELLEGFGIGLGDVSFASRMQGDPALRDAVSDWLEGQPVRPGEVDASEWLRYEQHKHTQLLAAAAAGSTKETR